MLSGVDVRRPKKITCPALSGMKIQIKSEITVDAAGQNAGLSDRVVPLHLRCLPWRCHSLHRLELYNNLTLTTSLTEVYTPHVFTLVLS